MVACFMKGRHLNIASSSYDFCPLPSQSYSATGLAREAREIAACTAHEAGLQAWHFKEHSMGLKYYSACGAGSWMRKYHELKPRGSKVRGIRRGAHVP